MISLFTNWRCRCSQLGKILTKEEKITPKQLARIKELENRTKALTENMKKELKDLIAKRDAPDELPSGVKSYLDKVFFKEFDNRIKIVHTDSMTKGETCEQDSLQLLSDIDGEFYEKNETRFFNEYIEGEPDNIQFNIKDIKTNEDIESFFKAVLTKLYEWQIRGYCWLTGKLDGELVYCLVNNPIHQLNNKLYYLKNALLDLDGTSEEYKKEAQQIERNMIFDIEAWKENYPNYQWENTEFNFSISKIRRVKRFKIELFPDHIKFIKKRVEMCREYLIKKEQAELEIIKNYSEDDYKAKIEYIKSKLKQAA